MPELPEVETIVNYLSTKLVGKKIKAIKVFKPKSFIGQPRDVIGRKILSVERRAKLIIIQLSNGKYLLVHLKMSGQLLISPPRCTAPQPFGAGQAGATSPRRCLGPTKYTRVIIEFDDKTRLLFNDLRIFGWIKIVNSEKLKVESLKFGPEPLGKELTEEYLQKVFAKTKKPIKLVLMDQEKLAGIGNIYSNEILFAAKINPLKPADQLKDQEIKVLRDSIIKILLKAIKYKGSSAADEQYVQANGQKGSFQNHFSVYQKEGEKCRKCRGIIKRSKLGGRSSFYCEKCQF